VGNWGNGGGIGVGDAAWFVEKSFIRKSIRKQYGGEKVNAVQIREESMVADEKRGDV